MKIGEVQCIMTNMIPKRSICVRVDITVQAKVHVTVDITLQLTVNDMVCDGNSEKVQCDLITVY